MATQLTENSWLLERQVGGHTLDVAYWQRGSYTVFFVAVGMLFDPAALAAVWPAALVLTLVVLSGKVAGVAAGVFLAGYGTRNAIRSGMNLAQIGEFSFVIAGLGTVAAAGGESGAPYAVAVTIATVTALTTPLLAGRADAAAAWVDRRLPHPVQTVATLYASWVEVLAAPRPAAASPRRRLIRLLLLDAACVTAALIGTSLVWRRLPEWLGPGAARLPALRLGAEFFAQFIQIHSIEIFHRVKKDSFRRPAVVVNRNGIGMIQMAGQLHLALEPRSRTVTGLVQVE